MNVPAAPTIRALRDEPRTGLLAFVVMVAGMVATPLFERGGDERRLLALVVVAALFVTAVAASVGTHGARSLAAAGAIVVVTFLVEVLGSRTGFPFGEYDYTGVLTPQLFGVPVVVSFAWAGITLTVHGALRNVGNGPPRRAAIVRIVTMALAITAWDVFLDPQMVGEGYWRWQTVSPSFRGIPFVNYLGWTLTAGVTATLAVVVCGPVRRRASSLPRITYATLAVFSTLGFLLFFDDAVVALVGGLAMGCFVVVSLRRPGSDPA
jgi:putative membrane protein